MSAATARVTATVKVSGTTITLDDIRGLLTEADRRGAPGDTSVQVTEGKSYPGEFGTPPHSLSVTFEVSA